MKHLINLERLKVHLSNKFKTTLNEIDEFLQLVVFRHEISELKYKEFELLIGESKQELMGFLVGYALDLSNDWQELYNYSYTLETKMVDDDKLDTLNINEPQFDADSPIKLSAQVGVTLNQILAKFGDEQSTQISNAISYAYTNGLTNQELIQIIRGTRKNRYQDGILQTTTRHAKTIAHTGTAIVASQAKQQFIHDNKDIIKGIKVIATLDLRTSGICRHLDGEIMPIDKAVYPPYHYNCRSSFEIVYDGYQSPKQRTSMDGVVKNQTYYEWLKNQSKAYQVEVLGKKKAKLFQESSVDEFKEFDKNLRPMTLDEIKAQL
jgi:putative phage head morphogenesis protein